LQQANVHGEPGEAGADDEAAHPVRVLARVAQGDQRAEREPAHVERGLDAVHRRHSVVQARRDSVREGIELRPPAARAGSETMQEDEGAQPRRV
jgi:hypothetical protein